MSNPNKFDEKDLDPNVLNEALQSLSEYYISKRRLKIRETMLGEGGFGTVRLAELSPKKTWFSFGGYPRPVAVKQLRTENHHGVPLRTAVRLAREIKVWASCKHDNILQFTGYYLSKDFRTAYLVSPYMVHGNIKDYLSRGAPSQEDRLKLAFDTIKGLAYLHSRDPPIVHGDLKSLNVLVDYRKALLSDFGLAKVMEEKPTGLSTSNGFKGTVRYTSPEVLNGSPRDCPSDIWAWGCLALEIITGNPPYHECQNETQVLVLICGHQDHRKTPEPSDTSSLPSTALDLLRMCWSFEPGRRPVALRCVAEVDAVLWSPMLRSSGLPERLFISSTILNVPKSRDGGREKQVSHISVVTLSFQGQNKAVIVKSFGRKDRWELTKLADRFRSLWDLKHKNLLELTGYSIEYAWAAEFYVISPYEYDQIVLLEYLRRHRHWAPGAKLKLLRDMLKGLVYLHSSARNVAHGNLNPWTVVVNRKGNAVLPLIGRFTSLDQNITPNKPTYLWNDLVFLRAWHGIESKSDIWSWACIVLQVMCEIQHIDGTSIHSPKFMEYKGYWTDRGNPEPVPTPTLPNRLLGLVRKCWNPSPEERPSASDCLSALDLVIQGNLEGVGAIQDSEDSEEIFFDAVEEVS